MKIRVCDDDLELAGEWVKNVNEVAPADFDISVIDGAAEEISQLLRRKLAVEKGDNPLDIDSALDAVDVLVIDYDLVHLDEERGRTTGEGVAKLARSYSKCGAVVVLNQFKGPQFDLGMKGHLDSHADLNVDANLIGTSALWYTEHASGTFNPTIWTPLPDLVEAARGVAKTIASEGLDKPILPLIGLDNDAISELTDSAFGFLSLEAQTSDDLASITTQDFLNRSLDIEDAQRLSKYSSELLCNFAGFRIVKWLDRAVLRPLNILIDSHHLIDRLPFLIDSTKLDVEHSASWDGAAADPTNLLLWDHLEKFHNAKASAALGRMVFDWHHIVGDDDIDKLHDDYINNPKVRFHLAEDTSRFVEKEGLTGYRADFHNFGDRRTIEKLDSISYGPQRRMRFS